MTYSLRCLIFLGLMILPTLSRAEIKVYFSPNGGCQQAIISEINKAQKSIDVAMYSFTSREIAQALVVARERHVKIRILLDIFEIKDHYSKSRFLINKGFAIKFHLGPGLMHDKFVVIDERVVVTGSFNWTITAETKNAENLLVINDKELARSYEKHFKHLWTQSGEGQYEKKQEGDQ